MIKIQSLKTYKINQFSTRLKTVSFTKSIYLKYYTQSNSPIQLTFIVAETKFSLHQDDSILFSFLQVNVGSLPKILVCVFPKNKEKSMKRLDCCLGLNFRCQSNGQRVIPSGQDSLILPARVANHSAGFDSSCSLAEPAI